MSRIRVLFDAFELSPNAGKSIGIYNYAVNLWGALLAGTSSDIEWVLICNGSNEFHFKQAGEFRSFEMHVLCDSVPRQWQRQAWLRGGAQLTAFQKRCSVYFSPKGFLPGWWGATLGLRTAVVVHDLIPLWYTEHEPEYFGGFESRVVNYELVRSCRHADALITISEGSADDIQRRVKLARYPHVVHNGLPRIPDQISLPKYSKNFIFAMTSSLPHKNSEKLLRGYQVYCDNEISPLDLIVCGIDDPHIKGVTAVKGLSSSQLHGYYKEASLFVFVSRAEGFGFPPLEAMSHGTPCLCADTDVLRETTRGNAIYVDPLCEQKIGLALSKALSIEGISCLDGLRANASQVIAAYSWNTCASGIEKIVRGLV